MASTHEVVPENGKTGTVWTAVGHIFCAVVGAGVLGLPNSVAWLGWIAGPICLCAFFAISLWSAHLLAQVYRVGDVEFARYHHAVAHILGRRGSIAVSVFQLLNLILSDIAYTVTGAIAMQSIATYLGTKPTEKWQYILIMGGLELFFSQVPSLEEIWWISALGTASSLGYVAIALGLGLAYSGNGLGTIGGRPGSSPANKTFSILNSLGNIAFAFGFAQVLLEVQDTLRQPPKAVGTMRRAISIAVTGAFGFYLSSAVACYAALGNDAPQEVLTGFPMAPNWVMVVANVCITVHMLMAYQVWAQPVFETCESHIKARRLRRQLAQQAQQDGAAADGAGVNGAANGPANGANGAVNGAAAGHHHHLHKHEAPHLPALSEEAEAEPECLGLDAEAGSGGLPGMVSQGSLGLQLSRSSVRLSARGSGGLTVYNSAPLPELVPHGWHNIRRRSGFPAVRSEGHLASMAGTDAAAGKEEAQKQLGRKSALQRLSRMSAMYHLDTGAADETVPLNDQGYLLPLWERILFRSGYVLACTLVAAVVPFFSAVVGLVGAVTFWPLTIGFPFLMFYKVHKPGGTQVQLMKIVAAVMLLVCVAATIGSVQALIVALMDAGNPFT